MVESEIFNELQALQSFYVRIEGKLLKIQSRIWHTFFDIMYRKPSDEPGETNLCCICVHSFPPFFGTACAENCFGKKPRFFSEFFSDALGSVHILPISFSRKREAQKKSRPCPTFRDAPVGCHGSRTGAPCPGFSAPTDGRRSRWVEPGRKG